VGEESGVTEISFSTGANIVSGFEAVEIGFVGMVNVVEHKLKLVEIYYYIG
jgi:hypothetical protein